MSDINMELKYSETHEWVREEDDGTVTIGITEHAQESLGDIVFVELPEVGANVGIKDEVGVIDSVKAASELYAPISGEILAVNDLLVDKPEIVNACPYTDGWLYQVKPSNMSEINSLMNADAYEDLLADS